MIWDRRYECMPRGEIEQLQLERLQSTLNRVYRNVSFYKKRFDHLQILPEEIQSVKDLARYSFHGQGRFTRELPLWYVCSSPRGKWCAFTPLRG